MRESRCLKMQGSWLSAIHGEAAGPDLQQIQADRLARPVTLAETLRKSEQAECTEIQTREDSIYVCTVKRICRLLLKEP
jgi:hypothetical protein